MKKLGAITDGISRDPAVAFPILAEAGLTQAELQFVWDKEIGDLDAGETAKLKELLKQHKLEVPIITRHVFAGLPLAGLTTASGAYVEQLDALKRCYEAAHELGAPLVRVMSFRKEMILFGEDGADVWNAAQGAWDRLLELFAPVAELAQAEGLPAAVETGNNANVNSAAMAKRLIDDLGTDWIKVLWDPANALYSNERAFPEGWDEIGETGLIAHVHIKDVVVDISRAQVRCTELGHGQMLTYVAVIASALHNISYQGAISLESVYRPKDGDFADGFAASVGLFKELYDPPDRGRYD